MKMETPIKAPCAGKILTITAVKGGTVSMGDVMMTIG
jgi:pyruvate carboxylase subunit B